ncbi:hypothetical protein CGCF245_v014652 [Colletotrichum fructicola]|nr:hypothetical protein CGCF245_v014652 [Colletotrichum fructicola]
MRSLPLLLLFFLNRLALAAGKANAFELVVTYNAYKMLWQMNGDAQKLIYPLVGLDGKPIKNNEGTDIGGQLSFEEFVCRYTNQRKCKISLNPDNPVRTGELLGTKYSKSARIPDMRGVPREQLIAAIEIDDTKVKPDTKLYNLFTEDLAKTYAAAAENARPDDMEEIDHACGFLSAECRADMETSLTGNWFQEDPDVPCSALILDPVPVSCQDTLGLVRGDVVALNSESLEDASTATAYVTDQITDWSWMIGTGAVDEGNTTAYYDASNRTFIIGTVFGYSSGVDEGKRQTLKLSLACLRPEWVPPSTPNVTSAVPPYSYPPQTTSATATTAQSSQPATPAPSGPACVSGTVSPYRTIGDFKELI